MPCGERLGSPTKTLEVYLVSDSSTASVSFGQKYYFLIRRLHSLTGIIPIGFFLIFHLVSNSMVLAPSEPPGAEFQRQVERIHELGALVVPLEVTFIFLPLLFHGILGIQIWLTGKSNTQYYGYGANVRYTLQRVTGIIAFVFIFYHVWQMHWLGKPLGGGVFDAHEAASTTAGAIQSAWWVAPFYFVGILCAVYHFANGIWTALITWGVTIRPASQRVSGYICATIGILLGAVGLGALGGFVTFKTSDDHRPTSVATQEVSATQSSLVDHPAAQRTSTP